MKTRTSRFPALVKELDAALAGGRPFATPFDAWGLIADQVEAVREMAREESALKAREEDDELASLRADALQALVNLAALAAKAARETSVVIGPFDALAANMVGRSRLAADASRWASLHEAYAVFRFMLDGWQQDLILGNGAKSLEYLLRIAAAAEGAADDLGLAGEDSA